MSKSSVFVKKRNLRSKFWGKLVKNEAINLTMAGIRMFSKPEEKKEKKFKQILKSPINFWL